MSLPTRATARVGVFFIMPATKRPTRADAPATARQRDFLQRLGYRGDPSSLTRRAASAEISFLLRARDETPAKPAGGRFGHAPSGDPPPDWKLKASARVATI